MSEKGLENWRRKHTVADEFRASKGRISSWKHIQSILVMNSFYLIVVISISTMSS
jgi:hypothetical protein